MTRLLAKLVKRGDEISIFASYPIVVAKKREHPRTGDVFITAQDGLVYQFTATDTVTIIEFVKN